DVWVPAKPSEARLPCLVAVHGGGYGEKSGGFINDAKPLLKRGYVVAAPDYALMTDAPVPLCSWDIARAIRSLRANAEKYRIDPERIGVWGWSAGGWIAQDLCYAGPNRIVSSPAKIDGKKHPRWFPMLEPRPRFPNQSVRVQAVVSDWGAGKLWDRRQQTPRAWLSPDDPPLFTCYNEARGKDLVNPVTLLRRLGVPSSGVYAMIGNTHVPKLTREAVDEAGRKTTWGDSIYDFLDKRLKNIDTATAPEISPHGGAIAEPTTVRLLTFHPTGSIHYTLDGTEPSASSPKYAKAIEVKSEQTLKTITLRAGLRPSRIATGLFVAGPPKPLITNAQRVIEAKAGRLLRVAFKADNADGASWFIGGMTGERYRVHEGKRFNPPSTIRWMNMDTKTGLLTGTPRNAGKFPIIVSCMTEPRKDSLF
ncbi:MAG: alpha/beta fold hydrolase, partial [Planctomycetales bacterium]